MRFVQLFTLVSLLIDQCGLLACGEEANDQQENSLPSSGTDSSYDQENCIEVTLPNIFDIQQCLGDNLNLCKGKATLIEGVLSLANCTVSGLLKNLSPLRALITVRDLLVALLGKLIPPLGDLLNTLDLFTLLSSGDIKDNVCHVELKITIPNSLGKCVDDTLKLCKNGTTIDNTVVKSLVDTVTCLVKDLLTNTPQETVSGLLCDVARTLSTVLGQIPGGGILSEPIKQILNAEAYLCITGTSPCPYYTSLAWQAKVTTASYCLSDQIV